MRAKAAVGVVTSYEKIVWGLTSGRYEIDGIRAFCSEYQQDCPIVGTQIVSTELCENVIIRKALYYGAGGPENVLGDDERAHVLTAIAISDANIGEVKTGVKEKYDVFYWDLVNHPEEYPDPPSYFKVYLAYPSNPQMQTLAFYIMEDEGHVEGIKYSSDPLITEENDCYTLGGAEYGVYASESLSEETKVGVLQTKEDGTTNVLELKQGTYYVREEKVPKGYALDPKVYSFEIVPEQTVTLQFHDNPQVNPIDLILQKVDAQTGENKGQESATLEGAEFSVKYFQGHYEEGVNPEDVGVVPTKTWICKTDAKGQAFLNEELPLGTVTIQEIKPSKGYQINTELFVRQIHAEGTERQVHTYQYPTIREEKIPPYTLQLIKKDDYGNFLEDAEFTLYQEEECKEVIAVGTTDEKGELTFEGLEVEQTYYLKETKAPAGYIADDEVYHIYSSESETYQLEIVNEAEIILPKTGSNTTVLVPSIGILCCGIGIYLMTKKRRKNI